jgi:hypothetical protein
VCATNLEGRAPSDEPHNTYVIQLMASDNRPKSESKLYRAISFTTPPHISLLTWQITKRKDVESKLASALTIILGMWNRKEGGFVVVPAGAETDSIVTQLLHR